MVWLDNPAICGAQVEGTVSSGSSTTFKRDEGATPYSVM